jgi:GNAT superfamily N-acetyltransferase
MHMLHVKLLARSDYDFAVDLANTMNWNMAETDFEFLSMLEPAGCFLLQDDCENVGIATAISYGKVGWFGNLVIKETYRRRGAGEMLVNHAVAYLKGKGVETVGLYAYPHLEAFYGKMGFKPNSNFSLLHVECLTKINAVSLPAINKKIFSKIVKFDTSYFGGDRTRLLKTIIQDQNNQSCYITENNSITGYVAVTVTSQAAWIGPLVCQPKRFDAATDLLTSVLSNLTGKSVYVVISKKDTPLHDFFFKTGFSEEFSVVRMFLGKATAQDCVYIAESLERG